MALRLMFNNSYPSYLKAQTEASQSLRLVYRLCWKDLTPAVLQYVQRVANVRGMEAQTKKRENMYVELQATKVGRMIWNVSVKTKAKY